MKTLHAAYRRILNLWPDFAKLKRANLPDDLLLVKRFERDLPAGGTEILPAPKNPAEHQEMMKDPKITKLYYSTHMVEKFKYLAFILLGIQYLEEHAEFEAAHIGQAVLQEKVKDEKKRLVGNETTAGTHT